MYERKQEEQFSTGRKLVIIIAILLSIISIFSIVYLMKQNDTMSMRVSILISACVLGISLAIFLVAIGSDTSSSPSVDAFAISGLFR